MTMEGVLVSGEPGSKKTGEGMRLPTAVFPSNCVSRRLRRIGCLRIFALCVALIVSGTALATDTCRESGGNQTCTGNAPVVGDWSYGVNPCGSTPWDTFGAGVCSALGGTQQPDGLCANPTKTLTEALIPLAVEKGWLAFGACTMHATPGSWDTPINGSVCGDLNNGENWPPQYSSGIETFSYMVVPATGTGQTYNSCVNTINHTPPASAYASRSRSVSWACPLIGGCQEYQDNTCSVGHPIKPGTGAKVFTETDLTVASSPLQLTRYYNSQGFYRPSGAASVSPGMLGDYWRTNYDRRVYAISGSTYVAAAVQSADGSVKYFNSAGAEVQHFNGSAADVLTPISGGGWTLTRGDDIVETYNASGYLIGIWDKVGLQQTLAYDGTNRILSVTDVRGRSLSFAYSGNVQTYSGGTVTVTAPDGTSFLYTVDTKGNLNSATYPSSIVRQYLYEKSAWPHAVTGIIDENGVRYESIDYDDSGRSTASYLAPNTNNGMIARNTFTYNADGTTTLVSPLGLSSTLAFVTVNGVVNLASATQPCEACAGAQSKSYDSAGYIQSKTDFNGRTTNYRYDDTRGLETQRVEATGSTSQRTTNTTWNANFRVPDQRSVVNAGNTTEALTKWAYNSRGQVLARCEADPTQTAALSYTCGSANNAPEGVRQTSYTYCEQAGVTAGTCPIIGLTLSVDGPRTDVSDVTTYTYYQNTDLSGCSALGGACHYAGDLLQVTNALGQSTTYISYDKNGRVTRMSDANGTLTDMAYHARGWLLTRTVRANADGSASANDATSTFAYDKVGQVKQTTQPDGAYLIYNYDDAHRLTDITDKLGNLIHYTLDAAGNRTAEMSVDPFNTMRRQISRQYNQLNRLTKVFNAAGYAVQQYSNPADAPPAGITYTDGYDSNGNAIYSVDGNSVGTEQQYDPLNRLVKTLQDHAGTGATKDTTTQYAYDARDNLRSVADPDNLTTNYTYDGLSNLTNLSSPDTGGTFYGYDAAGNRKTQTDARGIVTAYNYDVLNRLIGISYPTSSLNIIYAYDLPNTATGCASSYPIGRLSRMTDSSGSTVYCYDRRGNVTSKTQLLQGAGAGVSNVPTNWALASNGGVASASSTYTPTNGYPVSAVNNGDRTGRGWGNGGGWNDNTQAAFPDWVQINLAATQTISSVVVYTLQDNFAQGVDPSDTMTFTQYGLTAFDVQLLIGGNWVSVGSITGNNLVKRTVSFAPMATSAIRVVCNDSADHAWSRVVQVEAWGVKSVGNAAWAGNGGVASASSTYTSASGYSVSAVNDGDRTGRSWGNGGGWNDNTFQAFPDYVQINFASAQFIDTITVYTLQDNFANGVDPSDTMTFTRWGVTAFHVDVLSGGVWTTLATVTGNNLVKRKVSFAPTYATAIRVYVDASADNQWSRLVEVEAGNDAGMSVTNYSYTLADRLASMTYPSGATVTYARDAAGRVNGVTFKTNATAPTQTLISNATYYPFGPLQTLTYGNGHTLTKTYDQDYAISSVQSSLSTATVIGATVDVLGNLTSASNPIGASPPTQKYLYDPLYRLTTSQTGATPPGMLEQYTYGKTGDRTSVALSGGPATSYTYKVGTHQLSAIGAAGRTYDANGNIQSAGTATVTYDDRNRLVNAIGNVYAYNGKGERVEKTVSGTTTTFVYGEGGQLIGEYSGGNVQEYVYLDGTPIGIANGQLYYVETDQLSSPRVVVLPGATSSGDTVVWKWDYFGSVFGTNMPNPQTLTVNLRFPGQYFDTETGLHYNYKRDYEPATGRYIESDPVGLRGGPSTYIYVIGNPLRFQDPNGLQPTIRCNGKGENGDYEVVNPYKNQCYGECTRKHEESHIADWKSRYGADSCKNKPFGWLPMEDTQDYKNFLQQSECRAHWIGRKCINELPATCDCDYYARKENDGVIANCPQKYW